MEKLICHSFRNQVCIVIIQGTKNELGQIKIMHNIANCDTHGMENDCYNDCWQCMSKTLQIPITVVVIDENNNNIIDKFHIK